MKQNRKKVSVSPEKPITMNDLGTFTEEVIFPGVERMVKEVKNDVRDVRNDLADTRKELAAHIVRLAECAEKLDEQIENMRRHNMAVLQSNDTIITKLDTMLKDQAAYDSLHQRITDDLMDHDKRITKLEEVKS